MAGWGSSQLQNLDLLYLHYNQLTALPPEIGQLQKLAHLDLRVNPLTTLPPELGQLQNLTFLNLRANPLRDCLPAGWRHQDVEIWPAVRPPLCTD